MAHAAWLTTPETARDMVLRTTGRQRMPEPLQRARDLSRRLRSEYESGGRHRNAGRDPWIGGEGRSARPTAQCNDYEGEDVAHESSRLARRDHRGGHDGTWHRAGRCHSRASRSDCYDESSEALGAAKSGIELTLDKGLARGVVTRSEKEETLAGSSSSTTLEEAVKGAAS